MQVTRADVPGSVAILRAPVDVPATTLSSQGARITVLGLDASSIYARQQTHSFRDKISETLTLQARDAGGLLSGHAYCADRDNVANDSVDQPGSAYGVCVRLQIWRLCQSQHSLSFM